MEKLQSSQAEVKRTELKFELSLKIQNLPVEFKHIYYLLKQTRNQSHNSVYDIIKNYLTLDEPGRCAQF